MASDAEIDLVVNASNTLDEVQRDLQRIVTRAENTAPDVTLAAVLDQTSSLRDVESRLEDVIRRAEAGAPDVDVDATLNQLASVRQLRRQLDFLVNQAEATTGEIDLTATLNTADSIANVRDELDEVRRRAEEDRDIRLRVDVDSDDANRRLGDTDNSITRVIGSATRALGPLAALGGRIGAVGGAAGAAAPLLAGVVTAIENVAPAAAVGVSAMLALQVVTQTLRVGFLGVQDAIEAAFDPDADPAELAEALERLAPSARSFVEELRGMRSAFDEIRLDVQQRLFLGFDSVLERLAGGVLPRLGTAGGIVADQLNEMAHQAATAAADFGESSAFGDALNGSIIALRNLERVPAQAVTALGKLAAASAPAFARITSAAGKAFDRISDRLNAAFESGALEQAINEAVDVLAGFARSIGNIFKGIGNITDALAANGEGLFSVFEKITSAFAEVTAAKGFQDALTALADVVGALVDGALPIFVELLKGLGPVFEVLGPPISSLISTLAGAASEIVPILNQVLLSLGTALAAFVPLLEPIIELFGEILEAILPALNPLLQALADIFKELQPFIEQVADVLVSALVPIFTTFATQILPVLLPPLLELASIIFPLLSEILTELSPLIEDLVALFADMFEELGPLIGQVLQLAVSLLEKLAPILPPLLAVIIRVIEFGFKIFEWVIRNIVIPAIQFLTKLLEGDFAGAWEMIENAVGTATDAIMNFVSRMAEEIGLEIYRLLARMVQWVRDLEVRWTARVQSAINDVIGYFQELPGRIVSYLEGLAGDLYAIGADVVRGFINGLASQLGGIQSVVNRIANSVPDGVKDLLGIRSPSRVLMEVGGDTGEGFWKGLEQQIPSVQAVADRIAAAAIPRALGARAGLPSATGALGPVRPTVNVFLGNHLLTSWVDSRIETAQDNGLVLMSQGVRR